MQHFAEKDGSRNSGTEANHATGEKNTTETDSEEEEEEDVIHATRHAKQTNTAKIAKALDSSAVKKNQCRKTKAQPKHHRHQRK